MSDFSGVDPVAQTREVFALACERLGEIRVAWVEAGKPLLAKGSMGQAVEHPLVKLLRETEIEVLRLGEAAAKRHRGPDPKAVLGGVSAAPSARLKAVSGGRG